MAVLVSQLDDGPISIHGQMQRLRATTSASGSKGSTYVLHVAVTEDRGLRSGETGEDKEKA